MAALASPPVTSTSGSAQSPAKLVNRLSESRSPYVRGHMSNPVAWQMWTPDTLALAKKLDRILFVSIGYAACHWCHVMERESFENPEIAETLNSSFIPVKIDREERPDIDRIYMNYVQATMGSGGWPLNVFLTPDLEPLFGGTYWPGPGSATATRTGDQVNFHGILEKMKDVWTTQRERCLSSAKEITAQLREFAQEGTVSKPEAGQPRGDGLELELLEDALHHFTKKFDPLHAGFGRAPKFPTPANLSFLLQLHRYPQTARDVIGEEDCEKARDMVKSTLIAMASGGIHDQIGHGFSRYSVTQDWSLPHFEKMLYDQAQLLRVYTDAYNYTREPIFLDTMVDIATYITSAPILSATGGFNSAEDADSLYRASDKEKREGAFYVWTRKEFQAVLGERDGPICARYFGVSEDGNVSPEHDVHDELMAQNVLAVRSTPAALSKELGISVDEIITVLKRGSEKLLEHRNRERPRPALDDKVIVAWNGLAIGALARASILASSLDASVLPNGPELASRWLEAAKKATKFVKADLYDEAQQTLRRVYREGPGDTPGFADDYAFLISGLLDLYEATFDDEILHFADDLQKTQIKLFWDRRDGGFFSTTADQADLLLRLKDGFDNAEPSTNGISARNLHRLSALLDDDSSSTADSTSSSGILATPLSPSVVPNGIGQDHHFDYAAKARRTCESFEAELMQHPFLFASMLDSVAALRLGTRCVTVWGSDEQVAKARTRGFGASGSSASLASSEADSARAAAQSQADSATADGAAPSSIVALGGIATEAVNRIGAGYGSWLVQRNKRLADVDTAKESGMMVCSSGRCEMLPLP